MIEIKITVQIPGLPEAINALAATLSNGQTHIVCNQHGANSHHIDNVGATHIEALKQTTNPTTEPAPAQDAPTTGTVAPTPAPTTAPVTAATTVPAAPALTLDVISKAGAALIDQGKMMQLCDLLERYGVHAITQLPAERYPAFVADLKALGAQL